MDSGAAADAQNQGDVSGADAPDSQGGPDAGPASDAMVDASLDSSFDASSDAPSPESCPSEIVGPVLPTPTGRSFYVATDGDDTNDGLSLAAPFRTVQQCVDVQVAGDTCYIKAGTYENEELSDFGAGTPEEPISYIGYADTPGEVIEHGWSYPSNTEIADSVMPKMDGLGRGSGGSFVNTSAAHLVFRNLQVVNYRYGFNGAGGAGTVIDNVVIQHIGIDDAAYDGNGIKFYDGADGAVITNNVIYDMGAEGLSFSGSDGFFVSGNRIYDDNDSGASDDGLDYYMVFSGSDHVIANNHIERVGELAHGGHGIHLKGAGTNNRIQNNVLENTNGIAMRHPDATGNIIQSNTLRNGWICLTAREGAHDNLYIGNRCDNISVGVFFFVDTGEQGVNNPSAHNNVFQNTIVTNPRGSNGCVVYFYGTSPSSSADNNIIANTTLLGGPDTTLYCANSENSGTILTNSIIMNVPTLGSGAFAPEVSSSHNWFYGNGFDTPAGELNRDGSDPLFENEEAGEFQLQSASPAIDAASATHAPDIDYACTARPQGAGFDIGAFEYTSDL